jgi:hypothetical protein
MLNAKASTDLTFSLPPTAPPCTGLPSRCNRARTMSSKIVLCECKFLFRLTAQLHSLQHKSPPTCLSHAVIIYLVSVTRDRSPPWPAIIHPTARQTEKQKTVVFFGDISSAFLSVSDTKALNVATAEALEASKGRCRNKKLLVAIGALSQLFHSSINYMRNLFSFSSHIGIFLRRSARVLGRGTVTIRKFLHVILGAAFCIDRAFSWLSPFLSIIALHTCLFANVHLFIPLF